MALVCMVAYDTIENGRTELTRRTLESLMRTVDWHRHRLIAVNNGSCLDTHILLDSWQNANPQIMQVITLDRNYGTAKAINRAWKDRLPFETCVKVDNDVEIWQAGWLDLIEEVFFRDPKIGLCGLKRKDLIEWPWNDNPFYRSTLRMLPHEPGEQWLIVEEVNHVMGTAVAANPALIDTIGYMYQPFLYGFDDPDYALRAHLAGFKTVFLPQVPIDHIDPGTTEYQKWKEREAMRLMPEWNKMVDDYKRGRVSTYRPSGWD